VLRVVVYARGAKCFFESRYGRPYDPPKRDEDDRAITDQSTPSRQRAAFAFGNASVSAAEPVRWLAMTVLTWRECNRPTGEEMRRALDRFRRAWKVRWMESLDGWIMEMQANGTPHFHLFHAAQSNAGAVIAKMPTRRFKRHGRWSDIVGGSFENWLVQTWLRCTDQEDDDEARAFNGGGICELFRTPEGAGRYVAKECSKRGQKILPEWYAEGLGRWWWLAPRWAPRPVSIHVGDMLQWPWEVPVKHVWETAAIAHLLLPAQSLPESVGRAYALRKCLPVVLTQRKLKL